MRDEEGEGDGTDDEDETERQETQKWTARLEQLKRECQDAAVEGSEVLRQATQDKWLGQTHPWKLIPLSIPPPTKKVSKRRPSLALTVQPVPKSKSKNPHNPHATGDSIVKLKSKNKPSKKRRILMRQALKKVEEAKKEEERKLEEARIKKIQVNAKKRARKRANAKARKEGGSVAGDEEAAGAMEIDSD